MSSNSNHIRVKVSRHRPQSSIEYRQKSYYETLNKHFVLSIDAKVKEDTQLKNCHFKKVKAFVIDDEEEDPFAKYKPQEVKTKEVLWNGKNKPTFNRNITGSSLSTFQRRQQSITPQRSRNLNLVAEETPAV